MVTMEKNAVVAGSRQDEKPRMDVQKKRSEPKERPAFRNLFRKNVEEKAKSAMPAEAKCCFATAGACAAGGVGAACLGAIVVANVLGIIGGFAALSGVIAWFMAN